MSFAEMLNAKAAPKPSVTLMEKARAAAALSAEKTTASANDARMKAKNQLKRLTDKLEQKAKETRNIVNLKVYCTEGKLEVRDRITGVARPVKDGELRAKAPPEPARALEQPPAATQGTHGGTQSVTQGGTQPDLARETTRRTSAMRAVLRRLAEPFQIGCANAAPCNHAECNHGVERDVCPLEAHVAKERPKRDTKLLRCYLPENTFISVGFPLRAFVPKIENRLNRADPLLNKRIENDDYLLERRMSMATLSLPDVVLHMRRVYAAELASILALQQTNIQLNATKATAALEIAKRKKDEAVIAEIHSIYNRYTENEQHKAQTSIATLDAYFRSELARLVMSTRYSVVYAMPFHATVAALFDILRLVDAPRRSDTFYAQMVNDVVAGNCDSLFAEHNREQAERGFDTPDHSLPASFIKRLAACGLQHVVQPPNPSDEDYDEPAVMPATKKARSVQPYKRKKNVCDSQTQVEHGSAACTAIAFVCALRFCNAERMYAAMTERLTFAEILGEFMQFESIIKAGAGVWARWQAAGQHKNEVFMLASEVPKSAPEVVKAMEKTEASVAEMAGTVVAQPGLEMEDGVHYTLDSALAASEKLAPTFGAIFTCGLTAIAIGRIGGQYWIFDSHSESPTTSKATLYEFVDRQQIVDFLTEQRAPALQAGSLRASLETGTFSLYVIYQKQK